MFSAIPEAVLHDIVAADVQDLDTLKYRYVWRLANSVDLLLLHPLSHTTKSGWRHCTGEDADAFRVLLAYHDRVLECLVRMSASFSRL